MSTQYEREVEHLERMLERGDITQAEFNKELREIDRSYRAAAEESAQEAYRNELERW